MSSSSNIESIDNTAEHDEHGEHGEHVENVKNDLSDKLDYTRDRIDDIGEWIMNKYTEHPKANGVTGFEHFMFALKLGSMSIVSGLLLLCHAIAPWWFTKTGGDLLLYCAEGLKKQRNRVDTCNDETPEECACYDCNNSEDSDDNDSGCPSEDEKGCPSEDEKGCPSEDEKGCPSED